MTKRMLCASLVVTGLLGLALAVGAQGPGPLGGFGRRDLGGLGGPGGRDSAVCAPNCPQYQFTYKRKAVQPILLPDGKTASTIPNTTTGTIAGDNYGSTYRDETLSAVGPWRSESGPQEFIYVRDMGAKMNYIVHKTNGPNGTYQQIPMQTHARPNGNPNPNWEGGGTSGKSPGRKGPTPTVGSYTLPDGSYTCPDAQTTTLNHGANSTTHRVYCPDLHLVLEEDSTDPRFGSSTYELSQYLPAPQVSPSFYTPTGTLVRRGNFSHGGGSRGAGKGPTPPSP